MSKWGLPKKISGSWPFGFQSSIRWSNTVAEAWSGKSSMNIWEGVARVSGRFSIAVSDIRRPISLGLPLASSVTNVFAVPLPTFSEGPKKVPLLSVGSVVSSLQPTNVTVAQARNASVVLRSTP